MTYEFRWNEWNVEHIARHGVVPDEAEYVVGYTKRPWPQALGHGKFIAVGQAAGGRYLQVTYVLDPDDTVFVIHARPLTDNEKRRFRRRSR